MEDCGMIALAEKPPHLREGQQRQLAAEIAGDLARTHKIHGAPSRGNVAPGDIVELADPVQEFSEDRAFRLHVPRDDADGETLALNGLSEIADLIEELAEVLFQS